MSASSPTETPAELQRKSTEASVQALTQWLIANASDESAGLLDHHANGEYLLPTSQTNDTHTAQSEQRNAIGSTALTALGEPFSPAALERRFGAQRADGVVALAESEPSEPLVDWQGLLTDEGAIGLGKSALEPTEAPTFAAVDLVDPEAIPRWLRGSEVDTHTASANQYDQQEDTETQKRVAAPRGAVIAPRHNAQSRREEHPSVDQQPRRGRSGAAGAAGSYAPRRRMIAEQGGRNTEIENESLLLGLIGRLQARWGELTNNSFYSNLTDSDRHNQIHALANDITQLGRGKMAAIMTGNRWKHVEHDLAIMLQTQQRYADANNLVQRNLGMSLDQLIGFCVKMTEGATAEIGDYAANASINDVLYGYLRSGGFRELPVSERMAQVFGLVDRERTPSRPETQDASRNTDRLAGGGIQAWLNRALDWLRPQRRTPSRPPEQPQRPAAARPNPAAADTRRTPNVAYAPSAARSVRQWRDAPPANPARVQGYGARVPRRSTQDTDDARWLLDQTGE